MRPLEIIVVLLNSVAILALYLPVRFKPRWFGFLPSLSICITLVHLVSEHYRWQMAPSYLLTAGLFLLTLPGLLKGAESPPWRGIWAVVGGGLAFVWWLVAAALPILLPVPRLPAPPGPYPVGSVVYDWIDTGRAESYSTDPDDKRELMVQIWYPATPAPGAETGPLIDHLDVAGPAMAQFLGAPSFTLDHLSLVRTHTYPNAPLANTAVSFPVVIYSHGYLGYRTASFNAMEALASSGYIAVAIGHTYGEMFTVFSDGRVVLNNPAILPPEGRRQPGDQAAGEALEATFVADERFVMDQLERLNAGQLDSRFAGKIDLQRVGLVGVSTGGGSIVWACHLDVRCKAGLAMDGWYEPLPETVLSEPLRQPFMFMQSETKLWKSDNLARLDELYQGVGAEAYHLKLTGVLHYDFGDYPLVTPLSALLPERGALDGERTVQVINSHMLAFFDKYLKDQPTPLLNGPSPDYPEAQFDSHSP